MRVSLLLFAAYREALGESRLDIDLPDGATAEELYSRLEVREPALGALRAYTTFAVNREISDPATVLHAGDEVAFLQPASGGRS